MAQEIVSVTTKLNEKNIERLYRGQNSPVTKYINKVAREVRVLGKRYAPRAIRKSIVKNATQQTAEGPKTSITAYNEHSLALHEGTRPHVILPRPNRPNAHLKFKHRGKIVYAKRVFHPGTRHNPFLDRALKEVVTHDR